jgi:hypothetical protein
MAKASPMSAHRKARAATASSESPWARYKDGKTAASLRF